MNRPPTEGDENTSSRRDVWQASHVGPETRALLDRDRAHFLRQSLSTPCLNAVRSSKGSSLQDVEGREILDFHGNGVHQVGYGHPRVVAALQEALHELPFCPRRYTNERAVQLAEALSDLSPWPQAKVLFAPGGTAAIGIAMKLARLATGRHKTISMWDSFHGASLDAISVGGEAVFRQGIGPLLSGCEHVPPADPRRCPLGCGATCSMACASYLEYVLGREGDVGAVIAEPVRCTTVVPPPPDYWPRIRAACDRHGTLLVFDEIPTCLGRTGRWFASEHTGVVPDMVVLGKGLGGGVFPMAALLVRADLDIASEHALGHYTHEKSPLGAAAGLATLSVIRDEGLLARSERLGDAFAQAIRDLTRERASVIEVRSLGMLVGVEMAGPEIAEETMYQCLSRGLSFKVSSGTVLTLTPPLTISQEDLARATQILLDGIIAAEEVGR